MPRPDDPTGLTYLQLILGLGTASGERAAEKIRRARNPLGFTLRRFNRQLQSGVLTLTAAWLPVFATLLATYPLRSAERQHAVLRMLQEHPSVEAYFWSVLSAVVMAPLIEELLFRVILQSWLTTRLGRVSGWLIAAVLFASVHGFPDSLAILPLALILGAAWHLTRSYWTIVAAHALFNAIMLALDALLPEGQGG
jgi:membrane protease YdiL (CAAX protease family)